MINDFDFFHVSWKQKLLQSLSTTITIIIIIPGGVDHHIHIVQFLFQSQSGKLENSIKLIDSYCCHLIASMSLPDTVSIILNESLVMNIEY